MLLTNDIRRSSSLQLFQSVPQTPTLTDPTIIPMITDLPTTTLVMDLPPTPVEAARSNEKAKQAISVVFVNLSREPFDSDLELSDHL